MRFLRDYWPWLVVPFVVVLGGFAILLYASSQDAEDSTAPFVYTIF